MQDSAETNRLAGAGPDSHIHRIALSTAEQELMRQAYERFAANWTRTLSLDVAHRKEMKAVKFSVHPDTVMQSQPNGSTLMWNKETRHRQDRHTAPGYGIGIAGEPS